MQTTLVLIKPDGLQRGLAGEIISRLERRGLQLVGMKLMRVDEALAHLHYEAHVERPFFPGLVQFITSSPIIAMAVRGPDSVELVRQTVGATNPAAAAPGTIRGDLGIDIGRNLIHGSDSPEAAVREVALFFAPEEVVDWERNVEGWIVE
ncbi:MAG: nucleoside-diphosphate kinase [Chloroflexi bacterium]|nr:nucleoside-diphosphate kinase [Chloroflexota bacterium]